MTWQCIDENTYIDDSLVTCAEYQLFIDEMRVQEKYCQPDHWNSLQFPAGQAREPILGVRHSDALAFCKWLTRQEESDWLYRTPKREEAENYPFQPILGPFPLGYRTMYTSSRSSFIWVSPIQDNPRLISLELQTELNQILEQKRAFARREQLRSLLFDDLGESRDNTFTQKKATRDNSLHDIRSAVDAAHTVLDRDKLAIYARNLQDVHIKQLIGERAGLLGRAHNIELEIQKNLTRLPELIGVVNNLHDLEIERQNFLADADKLGLGIDREIHLTLSLPDFSNRIAILARARYLVRECVLNRALDFRLDLKRDIKSGFDRAKALDIGAALKNLEDSSTDIAQRNFILDLYIDICTLQERITGRSPAFEGIRLIKERK